MLPAESPDARPVPFPERPFQRCLPHLFSWKVWVEGSSPWVGRRMPGKCPRKRESEEVETGPRGRRGGPTCAGFIFSAVWSGLAQPCGEGVHSWAEETGLVLQGLQW